MYKVDALRSKFLLTVHVIASLQVERGWKFQESSAARQQTDEETCSRTTERQRTAVRKSALQSSPRLLAPRCIVGTSENGGKGMQGIMGTA